MTLSKPSRDEEQNQRCDRASSKDYGENNYCKRTTEIMPGLQAGVSHDSVMPCHWTWLHWRIPPCVCRAWLGVGMMFVTRGSREQRQQKCHLDEYYLWCFPLPISSSSSPSTRNQLRDSSHCELLIDGVLLLL